MTTKREALLRLIGEMGEPSYREIEQASELTGYAIKKHLVALRDSGHITMNKDSWPCTYRITGREFVKVVRCYEIEAMIGRPGGASMEEMAEALGINRGNIHMSLKSMRHMRKTPFITVSRKIVGEDFRLFTNEPDACAWVDSVLARRNDLCRSGDKIRSYLYREKRKAERAAIAAERAAIAADVARMERERKAACPATVTIPPLPIAEISTNPNGVKVVRQRMIDYDPRYQVDPSTRVEGGFASAGIGRYL